MTGSRQKQAHIFEQHAEQWYVEPVSVTADLLRYERFVGITWDPACGGGNICQAFSDAGKHCLGTDIVKRRDGMGWWHGVRDFLADDMWLPAGADNIVTNPPFFRAKGTEAFIRKALRHARGKVAVFTDSRFLAAERRGKGLFAEHCPHRVWHMAKRPSCPPGEWLQAGHKAGGGTADYCWLVWDMTVPPARVYQGGWILPEEVGKAVAA